MSDHAGPQWHAVRASELMLEVDQMDPAYLSTQQKVAQAQAHALTALAMAKTHGATYTPR